MLDFQRRSYRFEPGIAHRLLRLVGLLAYTNVKLLRICPHFSHSRVDEKNTWTPAALVASGEEDESA